MAMGIQPEELIAEYCDLEAIAKALHSGDMLPHARKSTRLCADFSRKSRTMKRSRCS